MLTAMADAEKIAREAGQQYTVFTADQKLYAIGHYVVRPSALGILCTKIGRYALVNKFYRSLWHIDERKWSKSMVVMCICRS